MTGSGVACQLCRWDIGENIIAQMQVCILCNKNLCVKHFTLFQTSRTLVEYREMITSLKKSQTIREKKMLTINGKERVRNMFDVKLVQLIEASGWDWNYGIGPIGGYGAVGGSIDVSYWVITHYLKKL